MYQFLWATTVRGLETMASAPLTQNLINWCMSRCQTMNFSQHLSMLWMERMELVVTLFQYPQDPTCLMHLSHHLLSRYVWSTFFLYNFGVIKIFSDFFFPPFFIPSPLSFHLNILYPDVICVVNLNIIYYIVFHFLLHLIIFGAARDWYTKWPLPMK